MEAFSLLKYWRTGGGDGSVRATATGIFTPIPTANVKSTTKAIVTAAALSPYSSDGEDGPYFDLEFALPDQESDIDEETSVKSQENEPEAQKSEDEDESESDSDAEETSVHENEDDGEERELKFSLTSSECADQNMVLSPSKYGAISFRSIEHSSILLNASEDNSKFPVFWGKSATKFRVLLLKLKKSKSNNGENTDKAEKSGKDERENQGKVSRSLAVKFKVEEVPLLNLFTRDSSSKEQNNKGVELNVEDSNDRKVTRDVMQKYLKMVKPFYIRVSKRYVEKLKFPGHLSFPGGGSKGCAATPAPPPEKGGEAVPRNVKATQKQANNLQAGLRVVRKHLGKSRSASAAVSAASPGKVTSERRDDSLLQLNDGIQGAILHCKRSFNASRDVDSSSILCRRASDPSYEKSAMVGEAKGTKI